MVIRYTKLANPKLHGRHSDSLTGKKHQLLINIFAINTSLQKIFERRGAFFTLKAFGFEESQNFAPIGYFENKIKIKK